MSIGEYFIKVFLALIALSILFIILSPIIYKLLISKAGENPEAAERFERLSQWLQEVTPNKTQVEFMVMVAIVLFFVYMFVR